MIFLTVGTYPLQFDRLVKAVDIAIMNSQIREEIFGQIGLGNYKPQKMEYVEMLGKEEFDHYFQKASAVIGHAGMGTITTALEYRKPLLVMPRLKRYKEHVNDHQLDTARVFEQLGHVLVAYEEKYLSQKVQALSHFVPEKRRTQLEAVVARISKFLDAVCVERS